MTKSTIGKRLARLEARHRPPLRIFAAATADQAEAELRAAGADPQFSICVATGIDRAPNDPPVPGDGDRRR